MQDETPDPSELRQVDRLSERQVEDLCALYQQEWWSAGRTLAETRRMLERMPLVVGFEEVATGRLVAFARVLTDFVYKAWIFDVIVAKEYRGRGLGRRLFSAVVDHPELRGVEHLELYCLPELVPYYQGWGFSSDLQPLTVMRRAHSTPTGDRTEGDP